MSPDTAQLWFRVSARELKRTEGVSRSPIFSMLAASLTGLATIRGFGAQQAFVEENRRRVDRNMRAIIYLESVHRSVPEP